MFGKGVYFADMASKSAQYCCATADKPDGLLLLCEVALGRSRELAAAEYLESAGRGHHSVKGCGRTMPDPSQARTRPRGCGPGQGRGHERRRFGRPRSRRLPHEHEPCRLLWQPQEECTADGVRVPAGLPVPNPAVDASSELLYNEYIVYDPGQIAARYMLHVEFTFKGGRR